MLLEELVMRVICLINYGVVKLYSIVSCLSVSLLFWTATCIQLIRCYDPEGGLLFKVLYLEALPRV